MRLIKTGQMHIILPLQDALFSAQQTTTNRRALVALINQAGARWWGGHVDDWEPDEELFSSGAELKEYWEIVTRFKKGKTVKAHILMIHNDDSFGAVMLGIESEEEAQDLLNETLREIRIRTSH